MDEHIGLTLKVASQILSKPNIAALLQDQDTCTGTAQRLHNILVQFPALLHTTPLQKNVFQCGENVMRLMARWDEAAWAALASEEEEEQPDASRPPLAQLYLVALLLQLLSLRASFTPKQQLRLDEWAATLSQRLGGDAGTNAVRERLRLVRARFAAADPFVHMQLAPFTVAGLKHAHLHGPAKQRAAHASSASASATTAAATATPAAGSTAPAPVDAPDVPFAFLPRTQCPTCKRTQPFYCTYCYQVIHPLARDKLPRVDLPLAIDIILHPNVLPHKSTALQTLLLAHPRASVHTYPSLPTFDAAHTAVVFPSDRAFTVQQLAERLRSRGATPDVGAAAPLVAGAASDSDPSHEQQQQQGEGDAQCPLVSLGRVLFLEGTWGEAEQMLVHPRLQPLAHLRLDFSAQASSSAAEAPAGENAAAASCPSTSFWRYQRFGAAFLSSIEAIYHCMTQISEHRVPLSGADTSTAAPAAAPAASSSSSAASSPHRFDNLLWLFAMAYQRVRAHYCSQPTLLPPVQG